MNLNNFKRNDLNNSINLINLPIIKTSPNLKFNQKENKSFVTSQVGNFYKDKETNWKINKNQIFENFIDKNIIKENYYIFSDPNNSPAKSKNMKILVEEFEIKNNNFIKYINKMPEDKNINISKFLREKLNDEKIKVKKVIIKNKL